MSQRGGSITAGCPTTFASIIVIIRKKQMESFSDPVAYDLECRIYTHLTRAFPVRCDALGEKEVRRWVRSGMARVGRYRIEGDYDIMRFVDLMFLLGPDFETNPLLGWAKEILDGPADCSGAERLDRLYEELKQRRGGSVGGQRA